MSTVVNADFRVDPEGRVAGDSFAWFLVPGDELKRLAFEEVREGAPADGDGPRYGYVEFRGGDAVLVESYTVVWEDEVDA